MKRLSLLTQLLAITAFIAVFITACKKDGQQELTPAEEVSIAEQSTASETQSDQVYDDVFNNVMGVNSDVAVGGTGVFGRGIDGGKMLNPDSASTCFTVTKTLLNAPAQFPVKYVINFGSGCTDSAGHTRYGKIIITYTGKLLIPGSVATTTFDGFKIDSIAVTGTHKIANTTATGSNQKQFTVDVIDGKLTKPSGNFIKWTSHKVITQIEGNGTVLPADDIFRATGNAHGIVHNSNIVFEWNSEITEPLIKRFICPWISKGIVKVSRHTLPATSPYVAVLNYGTGTCDFLATLTINGNTQNILLPH